MMTVEQGMSAVTMEQGAEVVGAVRAALRIMGMQPDDFELSLFPTEDLAPLVSGDRVLSMRRLPAGEPRLYLVAEEVPWLIQLVGDLCDGSF